MELKAKRGEALSVLIVDDEPEIRELLRSLLEVMGCWSFIVEATSGNHALLKTQNQNFDLVITDLNMPKASGFDFIQNLKRAEKNQPNQTPILILSAYVTGEGVQQATELGVKHVLAKPCTSENFIAKVTSILMQEKKDKISVKAPA